MAAANDEAHNNFHFPLSHVGDRLDSEEGVDDPGPRGRPQPLPVDSALLSMGDWPDEEPNASKSISAVAGCRFSAFPDRPTQLQDTQHNCGSQDAKEDDFSEMSAHCKLLLRIRCGHSRRLPA